MLVWLGVIMNITKEDFAQAADNWDLERLYQDLKTAKGKDLTRIEKLHLRGLLCGLSPAEIAEKREKSVRGIEVDFCKTLYPYIKNILHKSNENIENWRNICQWLEEAGYKNKSTLTESQLSNSIPVEAKIHISNLNIGNFIENNKIEMEIGFNIQVVASLDSKS